MILSTPPPRPQQQHPRCQQAFICLCERFALTLPVAFQFLSIPFLVLVVFSLLQ